MKIGRLRYRVDLLRNTPVQDEEGNSIEAWGTLATVWADITPISSKEYVAAYQTTAELTHRIYIRYYEGLTPRDRIRYGKHLYEIDSVLPDRLHSYLVIMAREVF